MKAKPSKLRLKEFELLESQFKFIIPKEEVIEDIHELFESYPIDINFNNGALDNGLIQVDCFIKINSGKKPLSGYYMAASAIGVFEIVDAEKMSDENFRNLRYYSTLNMMINNLRNIIFQQSNLGPMGGYLLSPIDVLDLFEKKNKQIQKDKKAKTE